MDICVGTVISCQTVRHFPCGHPISDAGEVVLNLRMWNMTECEGCGVRGGWGEMFTGECNIIERVRECFEYYGTFGQLDFGTWITQ